MRIFLLVLLSLSVNAVTPLTGERNLPQGVDFGDPSPPYVSANKVEVFTTGGFVLTWKKMSDLLSGKPARLSQLKIHHPDGTPFLEEAGEDIWDPTIDDGVLYGGVLTPPKGQRHAHEDRDSWTRRVYAFRNVNGKWVREPYPLTGPVPQTPTWIDHAYGHHFITVDGIRYMFYERVTEERNNTPWKTELFARKMKDAFTLTGPEVSILRLTKNWPRIRRSFGGTLAEGPRPFFARGIYFISFSAGDYTSDDYGIHLLASKNILGPYEPYLTKDKKDLVDFAATIEKKLPLTWGGARASFFEAEGKHWALFHGIRETGEEVNGLRNVWLSPVSIGACDGVRCEIELR